MLNLNFSLNMTTGNRKEADSSIVYDTLVIGAGPAGLNAALYAKRKGLEVAVVAERIGGQVLDTTAVENWLGVNRIGGEALMRQYEDHVREYGVPISGDVHIERIVDGEIKEAHASSGVIYRARTIILATGTTPRRLGVPGESEFAGKGVSYCAICDGSFFAGKDVAVAGGGNAAVGAAIDLARIAHSVKLVQRSLLRADKVLLDRLASMANVEILLQTQIIEILGEDVVTGIRIRDARSGETAIQEVNGLFIEIGHVPRTHFLRDLPLLDPHGEVVVDAQGATGMQGIFAAGDVTTVPYKQIVIAAAEGAKAALKANEVLNRNAGRLGGNQNEHVG